jgi:RNAse (barnase) inhibitor barstar
MRVIELDARGWKTVDDFYDAVLPELGAPAWHGRNANALNDSVIWGGINAVNPPLMIRVRGLEDVPEAVVDEVKLAKRGLDEGREDFRAQHGRDIEVQLQIVP